MPKRVVAPALAMTAAGLAVTLFADTALRLGRIWVTEGTYLYGPVVVALALVYARRRPAAMSGATAPGADRLDALGGSALVLLSMTLRLLGHYGSITLLDNAALYVLLVGGLVALRGRRFVWAYRLPLGAVVLVFPFWEILTEGMHAPFRAMSTFIAAGLLRLAGIPILVEGYTIHLPRDTMFVEKACSGLNNLFAIVSVGFLAAVLFLRGRWHRIGFVALAAALSVLANGARIALIGVNLHYDFSPISHGPFHVLQGLFVTGVTFAFMLLVLRLVERREMLRAASGARAGRLSGPPPTGSTGRWRVAVSSVAVPTLMLGAALAAKTWRAPVPVPAVGSLGAVRDVIGDWRGRDGDHELALAYRALGPTELISRTYAKDWGEVELFAGYWAEQRQGTEFIHYRVRDIENAATVRIRTTDAAGPGARIALDVREDAAPGGDAQAVCYVVDGRPTTNRVEAKLRSAWSGLVKRRTNGAIVVARARANHRGDLRGGEAEDFSRLLEGVLQDVLSAVGARRGAAGGESVPAGGHERPAAGTRLP